MDNRNLIAFGMLLTVVVIALLKGALDGQAVKEVVLLLGGGVIGVTLPSRATPTAKPGTPTLPPALPMALLVGAALLMIGCATSEPYAGPPGPPTLTGTEWVWPHGIDGHLRRETVLHVNNSQPTELVAVLDCDPPGHGHRARNWLGSRFTLRVPPMTTQHILLDPSDHVCLLLPADAQ